MWVSLCVWEGGGAGTWRGGSAGNANMWRPATWSWCIQLSGWALSSPLVQNGNCYVHLLSHTQALNSACVPYGSQLLFPQTALTRWALQRRRNVFPVRYVKTCAHLKQPNSPSVDGSAHCLERELWNAYLLVPCVRVEMGTNAIYFLSGWIWRLLRVVTICLWHHLLFKPFSLQTFQRKQRQACSITLTFQR
jgi:hypothetical protein